MPPPANVLLIIADQWRGDTLGHAGHPMIRTPHLDALAREGVSFTHAYVQTAPCGPSRMCIYTGRYLCGTRSGNNMMPLENADENIAMTISSAGIHTGILGYNDYAYDPRVLPAGHDRANRLNYDNFLPGWNTVFKHEFDSPEYFASLRKKNYPEELANHSRIHQPDAPDEAERPAGRLTFSYPAKYSEADSECRFLADRVIEQIESRKGTAWFLNACFIKPHPPRICCAPYHEMYDPNDTPAPNRRPEELSPTHPYLQVLNQNRAEVCMDDESVKQLRANYYGMISEVDANLGRIFQSLKDSGQWDNTLIIFTSDHGEYIGDHYLTDKCHIYDEGMHVPYIVRDPSAAADVTRGQRYEAFVEAIDSAPTILDFMDIEQPRFMHGKSVLGMVRGTATENTRAEIHYESDFRGKSEALGVAPDHCLFWVIRDHAYKYIQFADESLPPFLFDLKADPGEHVNLAQDEKNASTVLQYCQRLLRWRMQHEDQRMAHIAAEIRER